MTELDEHPMPNLSCVNRQTILLISSLFPSAKIRGKFINQYLLLGDTSWKLVLQYIRVLSACIRG